MANKLHVITGVAGFIGRCLTKRLLDNGDRVIGFDNLCRGSMNNIAEFQSNQRFSFSNNDISQYSIFQKDLCQLLTGIDAAETTVWHLAANSDILAGVKDSNVDLRDTFLTTHNVVRAMKEFGLRKLAFASTSAVYGQLKGPLHEESGPLFPISNYGAMKLASEAAITAGTEDHLDRVWIYRFPNVVGGFATHGVIYDFVKKLRRDPTELEVLGNGKQQKAYLLVDDLIDAMLFVRHEANDPINCYNIGPEDEGSTVQFIAEEVVRIAAPNARIRYTGGEKGWPGDVPKFSYSIEKLKALGWSPRLSSDEAIRIAVPIIWEENA